METQGKEKEDEVKRKNNSQRKNANGWSENDSTNPLFTYIFYTLHNSLWFNMALYTDERVL